MKWLLITVAFYALIGHLFFADLDISGFICSQIDGPNPEKCGP